MRAAEIRTRFLDYFARQGHVVRESSSLVPGDDPTLLFTNAGMVQFKKVFLGMEEPPDGKRRATTSQKCVRAGGKHNDLEQVGHTARHHTFFEMLGNFSFGDYFKRDAIQFAWEFITKELQIPKEHLRVTVFYEDDEARALWKELTGLSDTRIYGLGHKDNFWQMADTGPCGPCTEIYVDLAHLSKDFAFPKDATGEWTRTDLDEYSLDAFVEGAEAGRFCEIWNLVFMQFDRQADGTLVTLPKPSVDTGAGLERIAATLQGVSNNYHTDIFLPVIELASRIVGREYVFRREDSASFRVLADHARAVAFLLADGVFPSNEGRGYVLRRILRRAVRHAWLLGRREATLVYLVELIIQQMRDVYPELHVRQRHIIETTRAEEERFLATIDGGITRFEELAPAASTQGGSTIRGTIAGEDAFSLYDTFGFPIDLTELMARERGYLVDIAGFEAALGAQRAMSQADRKSRKLAVVADDLGDEEKWEKAASEVRHQRFVGYDRLETATIVTAVRHLDDGRVAVLLADTPFYAESGGQVSDKGTIEGKGWKVEVDDVKKFDGNRIAAIGTLTGTLTFDRVKATVPTARRRDTERNHTATHLLHAALRHTLGEHVHQAGSVVEPERLRFDFTHHGPLKPEQIAAVEAWVNQGVWRSEPVTITERAYADAVASGAMALFGEKYGDIVRVVEIDGGLSTELCGGTHVRNTSEIALFRIVSENGVSAGVRRIVAVTGQRAFEMMHAREVALSEVADKLKVNLHAGSPDLITKKLDALLAEKKTLEKQLAEARKGGGGAGGVQSLVANARDVKGVKGIVETVDGADAKQLQDLGDAIREALPGGAAVLGAVVDGKGMLLVTVGDELRAKGANAGALVKAIAALGGGKGGGKPHMAQAGLADADALSTALAGAWDVLGAELP
jgi:alanyl-tRNA synthetase